MVTFFVSINFSSVKSDKFFIRWRKFLPMKIITNKVFTDKICFYSKFRFSFLFHIISSSFSCVFYLLNLNSLNNIDISFFILTQHSIMDLPKQLQCLVDQTENFGGTYIYTARLTSIWIPVCLSTIYCSFT